MVQGMKAFNNSNPKFAEVVIGDHEAKEMRVAANSRPSRSPYLKLVCPNGVLERNPTVVPDGVALLPRPLSRGGDDQGERVDWRGKDQVQARACGSYMGNLPGLGGEYDSRHAKGQSNLQGAELPASQL